MGDGDGWSECAAGHRHWGRYGAAGLLLVGSGQVVLQHRSIRTHEGGNWALPGGARDSHEDPVQTALREAGEEAGISPWQVRPVGLARAEHQGWSYTTVLGRAVGDVRPFAANWESDEVRWWDLADVDGLPLHPGFAAAWPDLRRLVDPVHIVVDGANVVGSRPDGWWKDRAEATGRLADRLTRLARVGIRRAQLPPELASTGGPKVLLPQIDLVVEGSARSATVATDQPADDGVRGGPQPEWWSRAVHIAPAPGSGDDEVVARSARIGPGVIVVTADRGLRGRLPTDVTSVGPSWLLGLLDGLDVEPAR